ncbi:hypothetical protein I4U23_027452 [Adineta vaga]|nr:hypothetical protein I4U23_027452 [Adineta vaga]
MFGTYRSIFATSPNSRVLTGVCRYTDAIFEVYVPLFIVIVLVLIVSIVMITFGCLAFRNIERTTVLADQGAQKQLTRMICMQVILVVFCLAPYGIDNIYIWCTSGISIVANPNSIEAVVSQLSVQFMWTNYAGSFYVFLVASSRFRRTRAFSAPPQSKSDWQLFTNDGKFDSKLPPYKRLLRKTTGYKLYVIPIPKSAKAKLTTSELEKPLPQVENIENYVLVWLDQSMGGKGKCDQESKHQLEQVVNSVKIFLDPKECRDFMSKIKDEKIFVIISGAVEEDFISNIHGEKQLESIYIYCPGKVKEEPWYSQYPEISCIYSTILSLCKQLDKDVTKLDYTLLGFEIMERSSSKDVSEASQQEASFMYDQLFRDIVLKVSDEDMQDMYDFCQTRYRTNVKELANLKELKRSYSSNISIYWYTRNTFLYRMLNKALRIHDYDTLYVLRIYIRHLHQQITIQQETNNPDEKMLSRGQALEKDEFDQLCDNVGGLISFSSFLSTTSDREVGLQFARLHLDDKRKATVLFEIKIEKNTEIPVAYVTELS